MRLTIVIGSLCIIGLKVAASEIPIAGAGSQPRPQQGKAVFERVCSVCHGREGRGDAGPGPSLVPLEKEYNEVLGIVREGTGEMPPIPQERISDEDVKQIVAYLKSLSK
jgi:mono/diheme cytochrome c family protein